jgi:cysteine-S-conjugate beta-lyase
MQNLFQAKKRRLDMSIFDIQHNRKNTRSVKWDMLQSIFQTDDVLPMWVADMDFKAPEQVNQALIERAKHGIYGYTIIDDEVRTSITNWLSHRHKWDIQKNWLLFSPGVVTSLHMAVQAFTKPGDKIMIQTPVYTPFYKVIKNHGRQIVTNPLQYENNYYKIDFADFEKKLTEGVNAFILCSPHNPVGRVWKKEELTEIARLCKKYDVIIISDEIHGDLTFPNEVHIPIASLSDEVADRTITCMSPSKTFNLAGLQASYIVVANNKLRKQLNNQLLKQGIQELNTMGNVAIEAAYNHGEAWLEELRQVLKGHKDYVQESFNKHIPEITVTNSEGTYLLWFNCSSLNMDTEKLKKFMIQEAKVGLNPGVDYGEEATTFMRMNIACPKATLEEGVRRIITAVKSIN